MSNWKNFDEELPPMLTLVLVKNWTGTHLRSWDEAGNCYDDEENCDDSGLSFDQWCEIPE